MSTLYEHQPLHLFAHYERAAHAYPEVAIHLDMPTTAFPELGTHTTYAASLEAIRTRAYQLATAGIQAGDFVMLYKSAHVDTYWLAVAVSYLGAVPVMTGGHLPSDVIDVFFERLEHAWLLYDDEAAAKVGQLAVVNREKSIAVETLAELTPTTVGMVELPVDRISYMTHTSGTTGIPKLIAHSANSMGWRVAFQQSILAKMDTVDLLAFHISPVHSRFNIGMTSLMALGYPYLFIKDPSVARVEQLFEQYHPLAIETHPNNFVQWANLAERRPELFEHTRYYHSTFDAINKATMATFLEANATGEAIYLQIYGQSECGPSIVRKHTLESLPYTDIRNMGVGYEHFTKARVADADGNVLPPNTPGNIHLFSRGRALTYYKEDARFQANVYGDWWDTGDHGMMTEDGDLILQDRQIDLVETLPSTLAIEDYLLDTLDWLDEVVIVRDPNGYPQPVAAVKDDGDFQWEAYWEAVLNLPHLNKPIVLAYDAFPRTATMKIQRRALEQQLFS